MSIVVTELPDVGITVLSRWIFNCYVVHDGGDGRPLVVDPGLRSTTEAALEMLAQRGARREVVVAATHGHSDHVGGVPTLVERGAEVSLPVRIRSYVDGEPPRSPGPRMVAKIAPVLGEQPRDLRSLTELLGSRRHIGYDSRATRFTDPPDHWISDGDVLAGAPDWQVLHTPGHTDDSTALWNPRTRVLLSGDAVLSIGGRAWFTPELVDEALAIETEQRLRPLDVGYLLPGHGRPVIGTRLMDHALSPGDRPRRRSSRRTSSPVPQRSVASGNRNG